MLQDSSREAASACLKAVRGIQALGGLFGKFELDHIAHTTSLLREALGTRVLDRIIIKGTFNPSANCTPFVAKDFAMQRTAPESNQRSFQDGSPSSARLTAGR